MAHIPRPPGTSSTAPVTSLASGEGGDHTAPPTPPAVAPPARRPELLRRGLGKPDQARLGGAVVRLPGVAGLPGQRRDVDDRSVALPAHQRTHGTRAEHR